MNWIFLEESRSTRISATSWITEENLAKLSKIQILPNQFSQLSSSCLFEYLPGICFKKECRTLHQFYLWYSGTWNSMVRCYLVNVAQFFLNTPKLRKSYSCKLLLWYLLNVLFFQNQSKTFKVLNYIIKCPNNMANMVIYLAVCNTPHIICVISLSTVKIIHPHTDLHSPTFWATRNAWQRFVMCL